MKYVLNKFDRERCLIHLPKIGGTLTKELYEHVKSLYRYTEPCGLEVHMKTFTKEVPIYENVNKIYVRGDTFLDRSVLNLFLSRYPKVDTLLIEPTTDWEVTDISRTLMVLLNGLLRSSQSFPVNESREKTFSPDSPFKIENVHLSYTGRIGARFLSKFTGRNISFSDAIITEAELNQFIGKWMRNEAYHNLETANLRMPPPDNGLNIDLIFNQLETEAFDATKRPQWYQFSNK